jgi:hypothetical protein
MKHNKERKMFFPPQLKQIWVPMRKQNTFQTAENWDEEKTISYSHVPSLT